VSTLNLQVEGECFGLTKRDPAIDRLTKEAYPPGRKSAADRTFKESFNFR
jgi:hypothetical protein